MQTKYLRQGKSIVDYMETVKEELMKCKEELHVVLHKPEISFGNCFLVYFDKKVGSLACRHGCGDNVYFMENEKLLKDRIYWSDDNHTYNTENGSWYDSEIYDLLLNWSTVKAEINRIITNNNFVENFKA